jgi:hypothetical protein
MTDDTYRNSTVEPIKGATVNLNRFITTGAQRRCIASLIVAKSWLEKDSTAYTQSVVERCLDTAIRELKRYSD